MGKTYRNKKSDYDEDNRYQKKSDKKHKNDDIRMKRREKVDRFKHLGDDDNSDNSWER